MPAPFGPTIPQCSPSRGCPVDPVEDRLADPVRRAPKADALEPDGVGSGHRRTLDDCFQGAGATLERVRARLVTLLLGIVAAVLLVPAAGAVLTPSEQKWVGPLVKVWNIQNQGLRVVVSQAAAKNALIAGEKPQNLTLTNTLAAIANCKVPADLIRRAGKPPTTRLAVFRDSLNSACIHDLNGANDFAKAIGAIGKANYPKARTLLKTGIGEFKRGTAQLSKGYKSLVALGGAAGFKA